MAEGWPKRRRLRRRTDAIVENLGAGDRPSSEFAGWVSKMVGKAWARPGSGSTVPHVVASLVMASSSCCLIDIAKDVLSPVASDGGSMKLDRRVLCLLALVVGAICAGRDRHDRQGACGKDTRGHRWSIVVVYSRRREGSRGRFQGEGTTFSKR